METWAEPPLMSGSTRKECSADCCYSYTMVFQLVFAQRIEDAQFSFPLTSPTQLK